MLDRIRPRLNHTTIVAYLALFVALGGSSYSAVKISGENIQNKSIAGKKLKNRTITKGKVKKNTLTGAEINETKLGTVPTASNASLLAGLGPGAFLGSGGKAADADKLDGIDSTGFLLAGSRGVATAGLSVNADGSIASWFNTVGGEPTVQHTSGDFNYNIVIPGASVRRSNSVLSATPETGSVAKTLINAGYFTAPGGVGAIVVQTKTPTGFDEQAFHLLVFLSSAGG